MEKTTMTMEQSSNGEKAVPAPPVTAFRAPRPKPGLNVAPPGFFRRLRRSIGGTVAYLASWWRY